MRRALVARLRRLPRTEREVALWMMEFARMMRSSIDIRRAALALRSNGARVGVSLSEAVERQIERGQPLVGAFSGVGSRAGLGEPRGGGEGRGRFAEGMDRVAGRMLDRVRWRQALVKQLAYPLVLLCGTYGLFGFMAIAIVPTLRRLMALAPGANDHEGPSPVILAGACLLILSTVVTVVPAAHFLKRWWPDAPIRLPLDRLLRRIRSERLADQLASQLEAGIGA